MLRVEPFWQNGFTSRFLLYTREVNPVIIQIVKSL
jgi:hypothetical protein